jgi:Family of unknown function (DUF5856)
MDQAEFALFISTLLHSSVVTHFQHWATGSYAQHKILQKYYERIVKLTDDLAESYFGRYGQIKDFSDRGAHYQADPVQYLSAISEFVRQSRTKLPQDTELQNLIDEIAQLIDSTLYKLNYLE